MLKRKIKEKRFTGTISQAESEREARNRILARRAAVEGIVLLKNEKNILPLEQGSKVDLYGAGAAITIKGGTGSGDVNARESVSIYTGMKNAGFVIGNEDWIKDYISLYQQKRREWRDSILGNSGKTDTMEFFDAYCKTPFKMPATKQLVKAEADTAIYVLSRIAGEGADRCNEAGDYQLAPEEKNLLSDICNLYKNVIVVINAGGLVDLSFMDEYENIYGLIQLVQPGMEGGNAFADLISGKETPSGKLADTWTLKYEDIPNSATYSHNDGITDTEKYEEGIYVGYRYFDTFSKPVRYCFGYGLSYTDFTVKMVDVALEKGSNGNFKIVTKVQVKNIGSKYSGKEVVQVYVSCPFGRLAKEYRRLVAFGKTKQLAPGESQVLTISFPVYQMASYDESEPGWVLEAGYYGIWIGNSLNSSNLTAMLSLDERAVMVKTEHICPLKKTLNELTESVDIAKSRYDKWSKNAKASGMTVIDLKAADIRMQSINYDETQDDFSEETRDLVEKLSQDQLIKLSTGRLAGENESSLGSAGMSVPGSAGETSICAAEYNLPSIVLADGPAGLRLNRHYQVSGGRIVPVSVAASLEGGFFCKEYEEDLTGIRYYQNCTAIPVGTLLAQSWNTELMQEIGTMIGGEMEEFNITLWLAPGMNIHRNPLCGRNFEYYSEDPLLTGMMASAITLGVQKQPGCGTTIKHFACNNQEDNRMCSDSVVSERVLREIYLKGFEIAVKSAQPMAIMTSYNLINGVHSANNYDLCTKVARNEWGFCGVIMTDWTTTEHGKDCTAAGCIRAGNDLIMPGNKSDHANITHELATGTLTINDLKKCVAHLVSIILKSNQYEDAISYNEQIDKVDPYN